MMKGNLVPWKKQKSFSLARFRDEHPFDMLHREIDELFEDYFEGFRSKRRGLSLRQSDTWGSFSSGFEISETDDEILVRAELPGVKEKDINVYVDEDNLTISGEKREQRDNKKRNYHLSETFYGRFHRSIPLPEDGIDKEKMKAKFKRGVLTLALPKIKGEHRLKRRIAISHSD